MRLADIAMLTSGALTAATIVLRSPADAQPTGRVTDVQAYCRANPNDPGPGEDGSPPAAVVRAGADRWRCSGGRVLVCSAGASGFDCMRTEAVDAPRRTAFREFCAEQPNEMIPNALTIGLASEWTCRAGRPVQTATVPTDAGGYYRDAWRALPPSAVPRTRRTPTPAQRSRPRALMPSAPATSTLAGEAVLRPMLLAVAQAKQNSSQRSPRRAQPSRNPVVGTWRLVGERYGPDSAERGPWDTPEARRTMTFSADGTATSPQGERRQWSVRDGSLEGLFSYSVGLEIAENVMILYHQPTSSYNSWAERWQRVERR